ncbi:MAG: hypothetical protein JST52_04000 [Bacteroidetes bacterium]|nr:hypothetical protein [Bacteroidota bacterium]MBS1740289.1 hypothetical protein [Bacteroidota bacterium]MBS1776465.1 hypothetical protein [Bacteroidota bacterium]
MNSTSQNHIVFQAYGNEEILHECALALLSITAQHSEAELQQLHVCIYTDQPAYFEKWKPLPFYLSLEPINQALIRKWRGEINFVHRVKIELLRDFASKQKGNILYCDTDVYGCAPLSSLFEKIKTGKRIMHIQEGKLKGSSNTVFQKLDHYFEQHKIEINHQLFEMPADATMWNAGVLGFRADDLFLLDKVLDFTDTVYPQLPKHVVEQFAFSLYFSEAGTIHTAYPFLYHYWNLKELRPLLSSFFHFFSKMEWLQLAQLSRLIQLPEYLQQKANFYSNRSIFKKLRKENWTPEIPEWSQLLQQF